MSAVLPDARKRRPQKRTEETRRRLMEAATELFSSLGFDGVTVGAIEEKAGAQRGLLAYHYSSKDELWRLVVDGLFEELTKHTGRVMDALKAVPNVDPLEAFVGGFIRFSANYPEFQRIIVQESKIDSWRMKYLVDTHVKRGKQAIESLLGRTLTVHDYYIFVGAAAFVFSAQHECKRLWDIDPCTDTFASEHASVVARLLRLHWNDIDANQSEGR